MVGPWELLWGTLCVASALFVVGALVHGTVAARGRRTVGTGALRAALCVAALSFVLWFVAVLQ